MIGIWTLAVAAPVYTEVPTEAHDPSQEDVGLCRARIDNCRSEARLRVNEFSYKAWAYRRSITATLEYHARDNQLDFMCESVEFGRTPVACIAIYLRTKDRAMLTRACELGDPGSCLLDTLDQLEAGADGALDELAQQCRWGGAMACAWRLEHLRLVAPEEPRSATFDDAFRWAQKACAELHEGVACAATAKGMAAMGWDASARQTYAHACELGYEPACNGMITTPLREEQEPVVIGAAIWDPQLRLIPGRVPPPNSRVNRPLVPPDWQGRGR